MKTNQWRVIRSKIIIVCVREYQIDFFIFVFLTIVYIHIMTLLMTLSSIRKKLTRHMAIMA